MNKHTPPPHPNYRSSYVPVFIEDVKKIIEFTVSIRTLRMETVAQKLQEEVGYIPLKLSIKEAGAAEDR